MLSPVVEKEINKYYKAREGNPAGIQVEVLGVNTDQTSSDNTDEFIGAVGFEVVADDPDWVTYGQFGPGGAASRYVIINGVADSPTHKQWEVLFNETFFQPGDVSLLRALIDKVKTPVPAPPKIAAQPRPQEVLRGATVILTVSATGTSPLYYQWHRNGVPIAGATEKSLLLTNVSLADAGEYSATVSNLFGSETSQSVTLKVTEPLRPVLSGLWRHGDGGVEFVMSGEAGREYHIEFSTDLRLWKRVATLRASQATSIYRNPDTVTEPRGFFRAVSD
ncbi:MAG: immunoglobulin domain-containing protein [Verrucomicrobia bacterium]|nr:immunoglobulin domain-containing protein [Verrucomicrobiota bacterium]